MRDALARRGQFCAGDDVDVEASIAVVVEERDAVAAGFEDVVLGRAAAVGGHGQRRGFLEGDGRRDRRRGRDAAGGRRCGRTHAGGVAAVDGILDLRLAVAAFERETERDLALEADAGALEQREDRRGVESRVGGGRGAHGLRGAAQRVAQIGVETGGRRGRARGRAGLGAERAQAIRGVTQRGAPHVRLGVRPRRTGQQRGRVAPQAGEPQAFGVRGGGRCGRRCLARRAGRGSQRDRGGQRREHGTDAIDLRAQPVHCGPGVSPAAPGAIGRRVLWNVMPPDVLEPELVGDPMAAHASRLALLRRWAVLLDSAFAIPGTPVRFGLDTIVGLVPGIGDLTTPAFTVLLLGTGLRMRVPVVVLARMVMNAGVDALIGLVPIAGDLVDLGWKANLRNLDLLERHAVPGTPVSRRDAWFVTAGVALIVLIGVVALIPVAIVLYALTKLG